MNYPPTQYSFSAEHGVHLVRQPPLQYPQHASQSQHVDNYFPGHAHTDYADFGHRASMQDDYEDGGEISTRPRLTKEQVDVLESQFQAQPKPSSNVKRTLAGQTKLTLPRVANWFQNRRAKAKQQKKQEEFEIKRAMGMAEGWRSEGHLPSGYTIPLHLNTTALVGHNDRSAGSDGPDNSESTPLSADATDARNLTQEAREAGWASLQRALSAATAARNQQAHEQDQAFAAMPPPQLAASASLLTNASHHNDIIQTTPSSYAGWNDNMTASSGGWSAHQQEELPFDFGFDQLEPTRSNDAHRSLEASPELTSVQGFAMPADVWPIPLHAPVPTNLSFMDAANSQHATGFQPPVYPTSRRGSASDELTSNFGNFALVGTPSVPSPAMSATPSLESFRRNEGEIDLAARRKRPRPAAIGSAALRSKSYGAPPSMSPTLRFGPQSPHRHAVRQVKSMGQNLNVRYGGIRKPSSAQRSPLNVATFAEADAFRELLSQTAQANAQRTGTTPPTPVVPEAFAGHKGPLIEDHFYPGQDHATPQQYHFNGQPINFNMASPPSTPLKTEFMHPGQIQTMMAPLSAQSQYAVFPDHTPPYSAGPLTNSSWSDAPFTSPEMIGYPTNIQVPHVMYPTSIQDFNAGYYQQFEMAQQPKTGMSYPVAAEQKQTEFFIQEFPRQREEHAHAAQQLAQQKPKNYVFANATPSDF